EMGALLCLADEPGSVERSGGRDAFGIACRGGEGVGTAHAVAMAANRTPLHLILSLNKGEHRAYVVHHRRNGHLGADGPHAAVLAATLLLHIGSIDRIPARTVIEIGQQDVIADGPEPARHVLELLADTVRV